jgi:hypothetical protein
MLPGFERVELGGARTPMIYTLAAMTRKPSAALAVGDRLSVRHRAARLGLARDELNRVRLPATANLAGGAKLAACKRSGAGNGVLGAIVTRCFRLEHCQHSLCAVRRPRRHGPPISLAQRLPRIHAMILSRPRLPSRTEQRSASMSVDHRWAQVAA